MEYFLGAKSIFEMVRWYDGTKSIFADFQRRG